MTATNTAFTQPKHHPAGALCSRPACSVTVPHTSSSQAGWQKLQYLLIQQWPYWLTSDTTQTSEQTVATFAEAIYEQYNGIQPDAGHKIDGESITYWLAVTNIKASQSILHFSINAITQLTQSARPTRHIDKIASNLARLTQYVRMRHPDYQARILILGAIKKNIDWSPVENAPKWWQFKKGEKTRNFFESLDSRTDVLGHKLVKDKLASASLLKKYGLPIPPSYSIKTLDEAYKLAKQIGWPVVLKPTDRGKGNGVVTNLNSFSDLKYAFDTASGFSENLMLEKQVVGEDFRLLVVRGKLVATAMRLPATIVGNGTSTVAELISKLNSRRIDNHIYRRYLKPVELKSPQVQARLNEENLREYDVPPAGYSIRLRLNHNLSSGGEPVDVSSEVHPDVVALAVNAAEKFGLPVCGVDYIAPDISVSWRESKGAIIELNAIPGLELHIVNGMSEEDLGAIILGL